MTITCDFTAMWWDGDNEGRHTCVLDPGHLGPHFTGSDWLDRDGEIADARALGYDLALIPREDTCESP